MKAGYHLSHRSISNRLGRQINFYCCTINVVLHKTFVLEPQNVGLYKLGGGVGALFVHT